MWAQYANICFLKSVWWARKLFNLAPNISALVLNCRRSDEVWPLYRQVLAKTVAAAKIRARNNGRSTYNWPVKLSSCRSCWPVKIQSYWKWNKFKAPAVQFFQLLFIESLLRNFDMKSWWHATRAVVYNSRIETDIGIRPLPLSNDSWEINS